VEGEGVVEDVVDQEVVGGHAEFSAAVVVVAVGRDDGVQLHLGTRTHTHTHAHTHTHTHTHVSIGYAVGGWGVTRRTFLVDGGTDRWVGRYRSL